MTGLELVPYVHNLYRHLAACDLAVVQGGLTTSMELTANKRPFLFFPLRHHFEQNFHVRHRLERYGAGRRMDFDDSPPERIAAAIAERDRPRCRLSRRGGRWRRQGSRAPRRAALACRWLCRGSSRPLRPTGALSWGDRSAGSARTTATDVLPAKPLGCASSEILRGPCRRRTWTLFRRSIDAFNRGDPIHAGKVMSQRLGPGKTNAGPLPGAKCRSPGCCATASSGSRASLSRSPGAASAGRGPDSAAQSRRTGIDVRIAALVPEDSIDDLLSRLEAAGLREPDRPAARWRGSPSRGDHRSEPAASSPIGQAGWPVVASPISGSRSRKAS